MARRTARAKLTLTEEEHEQLCKIRDARKAPLREAQRARILLGYSAGDKITEIARKVNMTRKSVKKWIDKALAMGVEAGLKDSYHRPKPPVITEEAKAWVVHLACSKPTEFGYAAEQWTRRALAGHVRQNAEAAGHPSLARASKATVHRILKQQPLHPDRVTYYQQRRDPQFADKMEQVLMVYQQVALEIETGQGPGKEVTVSVDEKPGVQAIALTAPDLPPVAGQYATMARDGEYKRLGTCSILAALDLRTGQVTARVERRHRSREFIELLKDLDRQYPPDCTIRIILDNHSAHLSKEANQYLSTRPNRFKYVLTPKHGSWLNLIETLFSKMARTFLKRIRVKSWEELRARILLGIAEINAMPVVHRWRNFAELELA